MKKTIFLCAIAAATSCDSKDESKQPKATGPDAAFVSLDTLQAPEAAKATSIDSIELQLALYEHLDSLMPNPSENESSEIDSPAENEDGLNLSEEIVIQAQGDTIKLSANIDLTPLLKEGFDQLQSEGVTFEKLAADLVFFMSFTCEGGDLSRFDGKAFGEIEGDNLKTICPEGSTLSTLVQSSSNTEFIMSANGTTIERKIAALNSETSSSGSPCVVNYEGANSATLVDCLVISKSETSVSLMNGEPDEDHGLTEYSRLELKNMPFSTVEGDLWFKSGSVTATIANWKGSINYTDAKTTPTYSLSDGSETAEGTLLTLKARGEKVSIPDEKIGHKIKNLFPKFDFEMKANKPVIKVY